MNDERNDHRSLEEKGEPPDPPIRYHNSSFPDTFISPGPTYLAPSSGFLFSQSSSSASWIDFLPSKSVADRLLNQYWKSVHPIARLVHKPSFIRRYNKFWEDIRCGIEPVGSLQAVVFSAMFSAVVSLPEENILMEFGVSKRDLVGNFQMGTESALARANIIRTIKIETLQAFVMYMVSKFDRSATPSPFSLRMQARPLQIATQIFYPFSAPKQAYLLFSFTNPR